MPNPNSAQVQQLDADAIQQWLIEQLSAQLGISTEQIDVQRPLDSYGLDSAQVMLLAGRAEKQLGFTISPILLWHYPTIKALSERIAEDVLDQDTETFEL
jgi:acyl carrier protein